jgi:hypothetical protein
VFDVELERRVASALHAAVPTDARAKAAIMRRVREAAAANTLAKRDRRLTIRRGTRHSLVGLALAAGIGSITTVSALRAPAGGARRCFHDERGDRRHRRGDPA